MGHYVLNHAYKGLVMFGVVIVIGFAVVNWGINYRAGASNGMCEESPTSPCCPWQ